MYRTIEIEGICDKTRYNLVLAEDEEIARVQYRDMSVPKPYGMVSVTNALSSYRIPPNALLLQAEKPPDLTPDSDIAAFWFVRSIYEHTRRPVFYYFAKGSKLICFPPVANSGDKILVSVKKKERRPVSDYEEMDVIAAIFNKTDNAKLTESQ